MGAVSGLLDDADTTPEKTAPSDRSTEHVRREMFTMGHHSKTPLWTTIGPLALHQGNELATGKLAIARGLHFEKFRVTAARGHELIMGTLLKHFAAVEDHDPVSHAHGREPMRDD